MSEANEVVFDVFDLRFMLAHGDHLGVKGGDGIIGSLGPIMRGAMKTERYGRSVGQPFDWLLIGHWHQPLWLPRVIVNGTVKGFDEYAGRLLKAPALPPSQSLFFVHERHGVTSRFEIMLDDAVDATEPEKPSKPRWIGGAK